MKIYRTSIDRVNDVLESYFRFCRDNFIPHCPPEKSTDPAADPEENAFFDIDARDQDGNTPLHFVAAYNHVYLVEDLLSVGASINAANNYGFTALHHAALNGNVDVVKVLLKHGAYADYTNSFGATSLMLACKNGHLETAKILLENGAEMENDETLQEKAECTPLILAIMNRHDNCVKALINSGANVNHIIESNGFSALMYAALRRCQLTTIQLILDSGCDATVSNQYNTKHRTALEMVSALIPCPNDVAALLEAASQTRNSRSSSLLSFNKHSRDILQAVAAGDIFRVRDILTENLAQSDFVRISDGCTPLMVGCIVGNIDLVRILRESGADVNRRDFSKSWTALMLACYYRHEQIVMYLIKEGADCKLKSTDGLTALDLAILSDNNECIELLRQASMKLSDQEKAKSGSHFSLSSKKQRKWSMTTLSSRSSLNLMNLKLRKSFQNRTLRSWLSPRTWWSRFRGVYQRNVISRRSCSTSNLLCDQISMMNRKRLNEQSLAPAKKSQSLCDLLALKLHTSTTTMPQLPMLIKQPGVKPPFDTRTFLQTEKEKACVPANVITLNKTEVVIEKAEPDLKDQSEKFGGYRSLAMQNAFKMRRPKRLPDPNNVAPKCNYEALLLASSNRDSTYQTESASLSSSWGSRPHYSKHNTSSNQKESIDFIDRTRKSTWRTSRPHSYHEGAEFLDQTGSPINMEKDSTPECYKTCQQPPNNTTSSTLQKIVNNDQIENLVSLMARRFSVCSNITVPDGSFSFRKSFNSTETIPLDSDYIKSMLNQMASEPYSSILDDEELDIETFITLTDADLREMGIMDPVAHNEILRLVKEVNSGIQQKKRRRNL